MIKVVKHKQYPSSYFIARPSILGNPFVLKKEDKKGSTIPLYKDYFYKKIEEDDVFFIAELKKLYRLASIGDLYLGCHCSPEACHGDVIKEFLEKELDSPSLPDYKVLECSSKGDKRFSALYAKVSLFGKLASIEEHYQNSKRIYGLDITDIKDIKGKQPDYIVIKGLEYDKEHLTAFYKLLWIKYFDKNPELIEHACRFNEFNDIFKGSSINCQADVIRQYVKEGRVSLIKDCFDLINEIKNKMKEEDDRK